MKRPGKSIFILAVTGLLVAAFIVLGKCAYDRRMREIDEEAMRLGIDEVSHRIAENRINLATLRDLYNHSALSAAKTLARIVADDPSVLRNRERFLGVKRMLAVDELHVSDSNGVLIACEPESSLGYVMGSRAQSAAFLPAITNRNFELVQEPMIKGVEYKLFQYAGVARLDEPGIVQIGLQPSRLEAATSVSDIKSIASTARIGRGGHVSITVITNEIDRIGTARTRTVVSDAEKGRIVSIQADCGSYRIEVTMPLRGWRLADDRPFDMLVAFIVALLVLICLGGVNMFGFASFRELMTEIREMIGPLGKASRRNGPIIAIAVAIFLLGLILSWLIAGRSTRSYTLDLMREGIVNFTDDYDFAAAECLFFIGESIVSRYPTPGDFDGVDLKRLLSHYNIDELNVIGGDGKIVASTMAGDVVGQNQWHKTGPRQFCEELLAGEARVYAQKFRESATEKGIVRMYAGVRLQKTKGYVQIGFDERRIADNFDYGLNALANNWTIGTSGYFILVRDGGEAGGGQIISCGNSGYSELTANGERMSLSGAGFDASLMPADDGVCFEAVLFGEKCLCMAKKLGINHYHRVIVAVPMAEIDGSRASVVQFVALILFLILGGISVIASRMLNSIAEDKRRHAEELRNAKEIQTESLPTVFPDEPTFCISAWMDTAKEVGGDFYDFYPLPSGRQLFLIADTTGKGIPAAMFMMKAKAIIRAGVFEVEDFASAIIDVNSRLAENNDANMFVTAWIGFFDPATGKVDFVNCGHNPPLVRHADGSVNWIRTRPGLALAAMPGARYKVESLQLELGDSLFLYTDGVTEAMNSAGQQYGEKRLESDLASATSGLIASIRAKVTAFVKGAEQSDDITMLVLERKSK